MQAKSTVGKQSAVSSRESDSAQHSMWMLAAALTMATSRPRSLALWWVQRGGAATLIARYEWCLLSFVIYLRA